MDNELAHSSKEYAAMVDALTVKGFLPTGEDLWRYSNKAKTKWISVRIDFSGFVVVNFSDTLVKVMSPQQVMHGLNYLRGTSTVPTWFI